MIATKFKFCKFRHALLPNQRLQNKQISISLKKANYYPEVLLDQTNNRANLGVNLYINKFSR